MALIDEDAALAVPFTALYRSLDSSPSKRGKQFERIVKWFLKSDPEWATQVDEVWLWDEWPGRWGADCGIDIVFRHKNGEHWGLYAVSCGTRQAYLMGAAALNG